MVGADVARLSFRAPAITLDARAPRRPCLHVVDGRVSDAPAPGSTSVRLPRGSVIVPGFVDPHMHLLATSARRLSVDLAKASTLAEVYGRLRIHVSQLAPGGWIRAHGHDSALLAERRAPHRDELDAVSPRNPLVLHDRTGHEVVCNTLAFRRLGLDRLPVPHGVEVVDGRPTGRLYDAEHLLSGAPAQDPAKLRTAVSETSATLAAAGVTAITDAGHDNGVAALDAIDRLVRSGAVVQHVEVMVGSRHLDDVADYSFGSACGMLTLGHVKIVPEASDAPPVSDSVRAAHARGWPVAIHVLDVGPLEDALSALSRVRSLPGRRDRLEHVALSLPEQVPAIARSGASVISQPAFLVERAVKYRRELSPVEQRWLYRIGSLIRAGVTVAASSDSPVSSATPLASMEAAITRDPGDAQERVDPEGALALVTAAAGAVGSVTRGVLRPRTEADFVVLDRDPTEGEAHVMATFVGGRPVFNRL